jgi:hypothetical protein
MTNEVPWPVALTLINPCLVIHVWFLSRFLRRLDAARWLLAKVFVLAAAAVEQRGLPIEGNALFRALPFGTFQCF